MNSWFLSPTPPTMQNLERVHGAAGADAYNRRASQIKDGRLSELTAAGLYQSLEQPRTLLCQGAWPTRPDFKDVRFTLWQGLMDEACRGRPAVLLYTRAESPAADRKRRRAANRVDWHSHRSHRRWGVQRQRP